MFLKFQNEQQRFFYLLTTAVFISVVMVIWSYAWSKYFDLGANESREAVEIAGLSLLLQFFYAYPIFVSRDIFLLLLRLHRLLMEYICICIGCLLRLPVAEIWGRVWLLCCICLFQVYISLFHVGLLLTICILRRFKKIGSHHKLIYDGEKAVWNLDFRFQTAFYFAVLCRCNTSLSVLVVHDIASNKPIRFFEVKFLHCVS